MTGLRQHLEYKAAGVDWLGDIPAHWEMVKLKNGFDLQKRPAIKSAGIVTAFRDGQVTLRSNRRIDGYTEGDKQIGYQTIHPGDLVIHAMDAFAGAIGVSDSLGQSTPVYSVCTPKPEFNSHFYARALRHIALTGYISSLAKGVRERSTDFRWADAKELPVPRPPIEEQNNIVSFLDRETAQIDDLIGKQERLLDLLAEKRQAIITHAVTKGLDPDAPTEPSGIPWLGDIPSHWIVSQLGTWVLHHIEGGYSPTSAGIYPDDEEWGVLSLGAVGRAEFHGNSVKSVDAAAVVPNGLAIRDGDVLLTRSNVRDRVGFAAVVESARPRTIFPDLIYRLRLAPSINDNYFVLFVSSKPARGQIESSARGSSGTMPKISHEQIRAWRLPIPPTSEQEAIVNYVRSQCTRIDDLSKRAVRTIELLKERREAVISAAVTGKIDVREGAA